MITITGFLLLTLGMLAAAYRVLSWKDTMGDYLSSAQMLYETDRDRVDALFVGSSHVYAAINPDVIWREEGIAGFDMAISGQDATAAYYYTKEAFKRQSPRVVVVDLLATTFTEGLDGNTYRSMLSMRSGINQASMVMADENTAGRLAEYLLKWPIIHTRYRELGVYDFVTNPYNRFGRGYCYRFTSEEVKHTPGLEDLPDTEPVSDRNRAWVDDFVALADRKGCALVTTILPHEMKPEEKAVYNGVVAYLQEKGVPVIDFNHMVADLDLSYEEDFMDPGHLNYFGGEKLSRWLSAYLRERYGLADHRGDPAYADWDQSLSYAEHLILSNDLNCMERVGTICSRLAKEQDLLLVLQVSGEGGNLTEEQRQAADLLMPEPSFFDGTGTAVLETGSRTVIRNPGTTKPFDLDICPGTVLRVSADGSTVSVGDHTLFDGADGLHIAAISRRTNDLIFERTFN
ncbi:MAG: hypothetical protein K5696_00115 [Lachnospiraceae bacterium]|nr:hypothetical protein [Lachnospiraceae bacterium]